VATTTTRPITFAEFEHLPEPRDCFRLELRHGELIKVPPAKYIHFMIQQILRDPLDKAAAGTGRAYTEVGFRPTPEQEFRIADVSYAANHRWAPGQEYLLGAPDIVVEVLSASNTLTEMLEKEQICLANGCQEFWVVDPDNRIVKVMTPDGRGTTYHAGQEIPVPLLQNTRISVDAIFGPLKESKK
jgi:Uma2 family endonuclease